MMARPRNQDGFVSILIALMVILLVSLIAIGFAFLARQNQEQAQNRILSTQAFYAAESGVNDAIHYITSGGNSAINDCNTGLSGYNSAIDPANDQIKYTCVLVDPKPSTVEYTAETDASQIVHLKTDPAGSNTIEDIFISWEDYDNGDTAAFSNNDHHWLPQKGTTVPGGSPFDNTGLLRATIIPIGTSFTANDLLNGTQTLFLYPKPSTAGQVGSVNFTNDSLNVDQGAFVDGHCNVGNRNTTTRSCTVRINNVRLTSGVHTKDVYVRLRGLYRRSRISVWATNSSGNQVELVGTQAVIDATGKANNVVRRIQVRVPLQTDYYRPEFALESMDSICKRLQVWPDGYIPPTAGDLGVSSVPNACLP